MQLKKAIAVAAVTGAATAANSEYTPRSPRRGLPVASR